MNKVNKKILFNDLYIAKLIKKAPKYKTFFDEIISSHKMYKRKNLKLFDKCNKLVIEYDNILINQKINYNGKKDISVNEIYGDFADKNRVNCDSARRAYRLCKMRDNDKIINIMSDLVLLRNQIAKNCGFYDYTMYKLSQEYSDLDQENINKLCKNIFIIIKPLATNIYKKDAKLLGLEKLSLYDINASGYDCKYTSFANDKDLVKQTIKILAKIDLEFSQSLSKINEQNFLDLPIHKGKRGGASCTRLEESKMPFIIMNNTRGINALNILAHEFGHAMHYISMKKAGLSFSHFLNFKHEVGEVASMSMELFVSENFNEFYVDDKEIYINKIQILENIILDFGKVASIHDFQKNIYIQNATGHKLNIIGEEIFKKYRYDDQIINTNSCEEGLYMGWQNIRHIFALPFCYIQYAIAQLGAISMRRNYIQDPIKGIKNYKAFLACGNTKTISETYEIGGIKFNMSAEYISELMDFVNQKLQEYYGKI